MVFFTFFFHLFSTSYYLEILKNLYRSHLCNFSRFWYFCASSQISLKFQLSPRTLQSVTKFVYFFNQSDSFLKSDFTSSIVPRNISAIWQKFCTFFQSIIINQSFSQPSLWTHFIKIYSPISNEYGSIYLIDCHIWLASILTNYSLLSLAFYVHNRLILWKFFPVLKSWDKWLSVPWGQKIVIYDFFGLWTTYCQTFLA